MKAKLNFTKNSDGLIIEYVGLKRESSVESIYKSSVIEAKEKSATYSKVDESVMKRKFSI